MKVLIVGGTGFLGGACARQSIAAGYDVTVLTRGTKPVEQGVTAIVAERSGLLPDLTGFDAVIDTCAYQPHQVAHLREAIGDAHYIMVSSISAYGDKSIPQMTEDAHTPLATQQQVDQALEIPNEQVADAGLYGAAYGPLKASCEQALVGHPAALIRLGLIVGPEDYTDRFTWWVRRMDQGGTVAVPEPHDRLVQFIDVEDAAAFLLTLAQDRTAGVFNLVGPPMHFQDLLRQINPEASLAPLPLQRFVDAGLAPWTDLPLVLPDRADVAQMLNVSIDRALAAGLTIRPVSETISRTLNWDRARRETPLTCGMSREKEDWVLSGT